tara:strand:- start:224 stop:595 length:372 start_codon:yes stop_codon:yes gene_type:complete
MRSLKYTVALFLSLGFCLATDAANATEEAKSFKISKLRFGYGGTDGGLFVTLDPAPDGCSDGSHNRMHLKVDNSNAEHYKVMVSGLITAHATRQGLSNIWYTGSGCSDSADQYLTLQMFEYAE